MAKQRWRKSSFSHEESACVALNGNLDSVRDTKNGIALALTRLAVTALISAAKAHGEPHKA